MTEQAVTVEYRCADCGRVTHAEDWPEVCAHCGGLEVVVVDEEESA